MTPTAIKGLLWLAFLLMLLGNARYREFVVAWHVWLMLPTMLVIFIAVLASLGRTPVCTHPDHNHGPGDASWSSLLVHALPVLAVWMLGDGNLGTHAAVRAGFWQPEPFVQEQPRLGESAENLLQLYQTPDLEAGTPVTIEARFLAGPAPDLITAERLPPTVTLDQVHGVAFRFVMVCCAADARPVGAVVIGHKPPITSDPNQWWRLHGRWIPAPIIGFAALEVEMWEPIDAPVPEYLSLD